MKCLHSCNSGGRNHCANRLKDPQCKHFVLTCLPINLICVAPVTTISPLRKLVLELILLRDNLGPWLSPLDPRSLALDSWSLALDSWSLALGPWLSVLGPRLLVLGSRPFVRTQKSSVQPATPHLANRTPKARHTYHQTTSDMARACMATSPPLVSAGALSAL